MTLPTQPFRDEHAELIGHVHHIAQAARELPRLSIDERRQVVGRILDFLRKTLMPHAAAEEGVLYPEWARLVGYGDAAAPLIHDHEAIVERVEALAGADPADADRLQGLLYGLSALIGVHFRKEEDIVLPALDGAPGEVAQGLLERMGERVHHGH